MLKRLLIFIGMGLLLTGCVLQSRDPVFAESDGALLPASLGSSFVMENLDKDMWNKEEGTLTLRPEGHHYLATDEKKKSSINALFVPLDKNWWVMQATEEKGKPETYILAEVTDKALLLHPLFCDDLKEKPAAADAISFEGQDCYLKGGQGADYFKALMAEQKPAKMRMVSVK
jgi:hypothetical protein